MPFPVTPSQTPSNTPTISLTPSITPTITPSSTSCPYVCCLPEEGATALLLSRLGIRTNGDVLIMGGAFSSYDGNATTGENALITNCGEFITTLPKNFFTSNCANFFGALKVQQDQKIVIVSSPSVQRYNADNTVDGSWNIGRVFPSSQPFCAGGYDMDISTDGSMLIGVESMTSYTNSTGTYNNLTGLLRLNANGEVIAGFSGRCVSANSRMTPRYDANLDKWYVAGILSYDGSPARNGIVRINNDGSLDTTFNFYDSSSYRPTGNFAIFTIELQADGKIICGTDKPAARYLFRLNTDGSLDTTFTASLTYGADINAIHIQDTGKIIVAHQNNGKIVRYNTDGTIDPTWNIGTAASFGFEFDINEDNGGNIWIVGQFSTYNGISVSKMVKLDENGNLNACPEPSPTPTNTPTPTITPTITLTNTPTQTPGLPPSPTITSTPTRTPQITPTNTPSPSSTSTILCAEYYVVPDFGQTMEWYDCEGNFQSQVVSGGTPYYIPCAQIGTVAVSGVINQGAACL